jgi:hypothetical protein
MFRAIRYTPFRYAGRPALHSLVDVFGPTSGGSLVTAIGSNFLASSQASCRSLAAYCVAQKQQCPSPCFTHGISMKSFPPSGLTDMCSGLCRFGAQVVDATVESRERMLCLVPPSLGYASMYVMVQVSSNGQEYSAQAIPFFYFKVR